MLTTGCGYTERSKDPVHSREVQAQLDTLYMHLEGIRHGIKANTAQLYDLCIALARQHYMDGLEAISYCTIDE